MKLKYELLFIVLVFLKCLFCNMVIASSLNSVSVQNNANQSTIIIRCNAAPGYTVFLLHKPERMVIDLSEISKIQNGNMFPMNFSGNNLIKNIRTSISTHCQSTRIVCDLNNVSDIKTIIQKKIGKNYHIILMVAKKSITQSKSDIWNSYSITDYKTCCIPNNSNKHLVSNQKEMMNVQYDKKNNTNGRMKYPIIVAIDAGHGGQDPGATGYHGIYEKNITLSIAKKLKKKLDANSIFKPVMIRDGDYFLSVMARSDLARKKKANILISIHVDSSLNPKVKGASVWILSNQRAKLEMSNWLQHKEKHAELLGGLGNILTNYNNNPYFNHLILELQFSYSKRVGYTIAKYVLNQLKSTSFIHKNIPAYSGFGVLCAPDIPSILVETGFISNIQECRLLSTDKYQEKIAEALYRGLRAYCIDIQEQKLLNRI